MKKFFKLLGIITVSLVCITIFLDLIIKSVVTTTVSGITGAPVQMDGFSLNIFTSTIHISGFKMYNPSGFPEGILVSCPKIKVIYDRASLFKRKRHFLIAEIELKEMGLVKNKEGKLNVDLLKIAQQSKPSSLIPMQIDLFTLSIGKLVYKDYTLGAEPSVQVYDVNRNKSYKGISNAQQLILFVLADPLKAVQIGNAQIYGVNFGAGVTEMPIVVAGTFIGKDSVQQIINVNFQHVYEISLEEVKRIGKIIKHDSLGGVIKAKINGALVTLILKKDADNRTEIKISARKYIFPDLDIAAWVLYQIVDTLKDTQQDTQQDTLQ